MHSEGCHQALKAAARDTSAVPALALTSRFLLACRQEVLKGAYSAGGAAEICSG